MGDVMGDRQRLMTQLNIDVISQLHFMLGSVGV